MKAMKALILVGLLATATLTFAAKADDSGPMAGTWLVTIQAGAGPVNGIAELTVEEDHLVGTLTTDAGKFSITGQATSESVRLYLINSDGPSVVLSGARTAGAFSGTATTLGGDEVGAFSAQRR